MRFGGGRFVLVVVALTLCVSRAKEQGKCAADDRACEDTFHEVDDCSALSAKQLFGKLGKDFEKKYWRKRPMLIRRNCSLAYDALKVSDLLNFFPDTFAEGEGSQQVQLSSFRDGDEYVRIINFYANIFLGYLDGASVVFNQFESLWPQASQFISELTKAFPSMFVPKLPPAMNIYITPPGSNQIFPLHNDEQDVLIMQISGQKVWRVQYDPTPRYKGIKKMGTDDPEVPALHATLLPGDLLYLPRHHKHEGYTDEVMHSVSISLTNPFSESEHDVDMAASLLEGQRTILKRFPLPKGRPVQMTLDSAIMRVPDGLNANKISKDLKYVRMEVTKRIVAGSDPTHHERSTSERLLDSLAAGVMKVHSSARPVSYRDLPTPEGDSFGKMAMGVCMNWLGFSQGVRSY